MALLGGKKTLRTRTARLLAAGFLLVGILLGVFDAPQILARVTGYELRVMDLIASGFPFRLGLDIQGGTHLIYGADTSAIAGAERTDAMAALRDVIERRVNLFGVSEPLVQVERSGEEWRLAVELAGVRDIGEAIRLIGETPYLEFREEGPRTEGQEETIQFVPTPLTGRFIKRAALDFDPTTSQPQVSLELTDEGAEIFTGLTQKNVGKQLAIYLDGAPISAPVVSEVISTGKAQISGNFTPEQAKELAGRLNAGALPVPITLIVQQSVGASLGRESLERTLSAGTFGFLAVAGFMIMWYRLPGVLSVAALFLYAAAVLAIFKLIPVTLTAAGMAGFILSIGMAVDANILIFERMKEELKAGKTLEEAVHEGFGRAWTSIRDSNVSSLITSAILYWLGTSVVQGFALTLGIGILVSMLSAISITRTLLVGVMTPRLGKVRVLFLSGLAR